MAGNDSVIVLLASINGILRQIAKDVAPQNESGGNDTVSRLHKGSLEGPTGGEASAATKAGVGDISGLTGAIGSLAEVAPNIKKMAGLSDKTIKNFDTVITSLVTSMDKAAKWAKENPEAIKSFKLMTDSVASLSNTMGTLAKMSLIAPLALVGVTLTVPVLLMFAGVMNIIGRFDKIGDALDSLKGLSQFASGMTKFMMLSVATVGVCILLGMLMTKNEGIIKDGLIGLGAVLGITLVLVGMAWLVSKVNDTTKGTENLLKLMGVFFAAAALVVVVSYVGKFTNDQWPGILTGMGAITGVLLLTSGLCWVANKLAKHSKKGIIALAMMEGVMLGAGAVVLAAVGISKLVSDGGWKSVLAGLGSMALVVTAVGAIAAAASLVAPELIIGSTALVAVEAAAVGATVAVSAIIGLNKLKNVSKLSWGDLLKDLGGIALLMGGIGALSVAVTAAAVPAAAGIAGAAVISAFCLAITVPLASFVNLVTSFQSDGVNLSPVKILPDGTTVVGAPVNIANVATSILNAVSVFVDTIYNPTNMAIWTEKACGKEGRQARRGFKKTMGVLGDVVEPMAEFVNFLSGYQSSAEGLRKVTYTPDGKVQLGEPINIVAIATSITTGIGEFVNTIYADDKIKLWRTSVNNAGLLFSRIFNPMEKLSGILEAWSSEKIDSTKVSANIKNLDDMIDLIVDPSTLIASANANSLAINLNQLTISMKNLDNVLVRENSARINAIKSLAEEIGRLNDKCSNTTRSAQALADLLETLKSDDVDKINNNIKRIDLNSLVINKNGGAGITEEEVANAISTAINGMSVSCAGVRPSIKREEDPANAISKLAEMLYGGYSINID